jgi:hypothetical protein
MNADFELIHGTDNMVRIYPSSVAIGESRETHGKYVRVAITTRDEKAEAGTDDRRETMIIMTKAEARAIGSAIIGIAADL